MGNRNLVMDKVLAVTLLLLVCAPTVRSQGLTQKDPRIEKIVTEISPSNIRATIAKLVGFGTRHTLSDTTDPRRGIGAARRWIKSEFDRFAQESGERMTVEFDWFTIPASERVPLPSMACNIVATLRPGERTFSSTERAIVISAHYDSRASNVMDIQSDAPGADDDGSGTALVLELARVLSKEDVRTTMVFICFTGEEQGLFGSIHWASMLKRRGLRIEAVFNNDIVGNVFGGNDEVDSTSVRIFSEAFSPLDTGKVFSRRIELGLENDGPSRSLARYIKEIGELYIPRFTTRLVYRRDRFLRGGDQMPFHRLGVAAVRFTESKEDFDHQHQDVRLEKGRQFGDLPGFVNAAYCANIARVNAAAAAALAFAPSQPSNLHILVTGLSYDTMLQWSRTNEPDVAGYFVRWRETTAPAWQHLMFTADTSITLKLTKDDYLFSVQAVDREGDPSLYSLPTPIR